jgi:hypothetical protein
VALDADVLAAIREHIGSTEPPTDSDLETQWDRVGSVEAVALAIVRGRLADLLARPVDLAVDGDYRESWSKNVDALQAKERELVAAVAAGGSAGQVTVTRMTRSGRSR